MNRQSRKMNSDEELIETLAAISEVTMRLARKLSVIVERNQRMERDAQIRRYCADFQRESPEDPKY